MNEHGVRCWTNKDHSLFVNTCVATPWLLALVGWIPYMRVYMHGHVDSFPVAARVGTRSCVWHVPCDRSFPIKQDSDSLGAFRLFGLPTNELHFPPENGSY